MYDPLIVDAFTANWEVFTKVDQSLQDNAPSVSRQTIAAPLASSRGPTTPVARATLDPVAGILDTALSSTGARIVVLFAADLDQDRLVSLIIRSNSGDVQREVSLPLGYGVSGWVAVNGTPMWNADARLDFPDGGLQEGLVRSVCVPVRLGNQGRGVLSVYSDDPRGFSEDDKTLVEHLAARLNTSPPSDAFDALLRAQNITSEARTVH